ncbi:hypothetical protein [Acetobacter senegalensis]|uniref:hypothetical protein n=1 Tax=Acetobacter senegalensis TaxID=446692 RepID=UPI00265263A3|nr:hypothetical protein [Acetobacter senegalensis]MDN7356005.1 hypothetical protein [Acetobacter senegalensis]
MTDDPSLLPEGATLLHDEPEALPEGAQLLPDDAPTFENDMSHSALKGIPFARAYVDKGLALGQAARTAVTSSLFGGDAHPSQFYGQQSNAPFWDNYQHALNALDNEGKAFQKDHWLADVTAKGLGGAVVGGPVAGKMMGAFGVSSLPGLLGVGSRALAATGEGAALAAGDAYLNNEDPLSAAKWGAAFGLGGSLAGEIVNPVVRYIRQTPKEFAADVIARGVGANREGAQQALASDPLRIVADDNASLIQALRQTRDTSGPWQDTIEKTLADRANGTVDRARSAVTDASGINESLPKYLRDMDAARKAQAAPLYEETKNIEVPLNDQIAELLSRPDFRSAQATAARKAANEGITLDADKPTVQALDYAKRALDDKIGHALMHGQRDDARVLTGMKNDLLSHVDDAVPKYAQARNIYAGHSSLMSAAEEGKTFLARNMSPDEVQFRLGEMSEGERDAAKVGFRQDLMQKIGNINADSPQGAANAGLRTPNMRETARIVLGDDEAEKLLSAAARERMYATTNNRVTSGSPTTFNIGLDGPSTSPGLINALLRRDPIGVTAKLMESAFPRLTANKRAARYDELARALLNNSLPTGAPTPSIAPEVAALLVGGTLPAERN